MITRARLGAMFVMFVALASGSAAAAGPEPSGPRPADEFRRSDPAARELAPVAQSSGLSSQTAVQARTHSLALDEVLDTLTATSNPRLRAAERKRDAAAGEQLAARGGFDPTVKVRGIIQPLGYYRQGTLDVRIQQATPLWGLGVWGGWRLGLGEFAVYDGKLLTAAGGELRAGATLPLWQGGPIDRSRADIRQAGLGQQRAGLERDAKQLELELAAATAYWAWVAAGLQLEIERGLLDIALERDAGLRRQIQLGEVEAIVGVDNRRVILAREARVVQAERAFQGATLSLSLYWRDAAGAPQIAGADRLPTGFPSAGPPPVADIEAEIQAALERRPDLSASLAIREQAEIELRLARNQRAPRIDVSAWVAKDLGPGPVPLLPVELAAAIEIEIPIPMREARGQLQTARAELGRVDAELHFARDQIAVEVRDAHSALAAAYQRARLAGEQVELAQALAEAELRRFLLGAGDMLLVNLREIATADAARAQVEARAAYFVAKAKLEVARGQGVQSGAVL